MRGGVGFLIGSFAGGILGVGITSVVLVKAAKDAYVTGAEPSTSTLLSVMAPVFLAAGGGAAGAYIGARKPECPGV